MTSNSTSKLNLMWKGKAKATESDYDDLNPTITYRHLLSNNLGVKDPFRVIALCDSDAFYAACEQVRLGIDPALPLVVQQWDSLIAVNYPARKFGISRMDKVKEARKRCPNLVVIHVATYKEGDKEPGYWENPDTLTHKVSLDHYRRESAKIIQMFKDGLPGGEIERASIDEAFIDFTQPVREELLKRYPFLAEVPPDAPDGKDSPLPPPPPISWEGSGTVIPITPVSNDEEATDEEEVRIEEDDDSATWHDVALSIAAEFMGKIRSDIRVKLGYTTSAGIARNKFLAKLTASYKKPNSQSILRNAAIPNYLKPMPFQKIRFLGGKLGKAIAEEYDVSTVSDLLTIGLEEMQRKFGENSIWVYEILRGIDRSEVKEKPPVTKSMQASKNLPQPIVKTSQGHHWIRVLAAELALRLREARESIPALWPKTIVLSARQGYETSRSKQAPFPFTRDPSVDFIAAAGDKLWKELVGTEDNRSTPMKITNVQLSFSGIDSMEAGQRSIEGFFKPQSTDNQIPPPHSSSNKRKREESEDIADHEASLIERGTPVAKPEIGPAMSFICDRCKKRIALPDELGGVENDIKTDSLAALRMEHDDFHFAQDLSRQAGLEDRPQRIIRPKSNSTEKRPTVKKKKKSGEGQGIAKFFAKS